MRVAAVAHGLRASSARRGGGARSSSRAWSPIALERHGSILICGSTMSEAAPPPSREDSSRLSLDVTKGRSAVFFDRGTMHNLLQKLQTQLTKRQDLALLFLRVGVGIILTAHGTMKLADPVGTAGQFASLGVPLPWLAMPLAIAGEFAGGLGLILGALTRVAALGPLLVMPVAIIAVHRGNGLFAENGGWEYPITLFLVSLLFVVRGGGTYSVDAWLKRVRAVSPRPRTVPN